ncbi:MAG: Uma2 family endonuclease, partial [Myxococcales bacterium]|nr:Uma2 family endonuclease [Myxococcales bacterium]
MATNLGIHYPGAPAFAPDLMVVLDVALHDRSRFVVEAEGRGVDFVLEVLADGDRRKDLVDNVRLYAELRIFGPHRIFVGHPRLGRRGRSMASPPS